MKLGRMNAQPPLKDGPPRHPRPCAPNCWLLAYKASESGVSRRIFSWSCSPCTRAKPWAIALRPAASGTIPTSSATSAPCTILASRSRAGSVRPYFRRMDSKLQRPSTWPNSTPWTSNGMATSRAATAATWSAATKRNSASRSTKRRMSQGQAIRSTCAFLRVTHFMSTPPSRFALGFQRALAARGVPCGQAASNVLRIEAALAERRRDATAHVVAVGAVDEDGGVGREFLRPLIHAIRVPPDRALHHVCAAREVVFGAGVEHLAPLALPGSDGE